MDIKQFSKEMSNEKGCFLITKELVSMEISKFINKKSLARKLNTSPSTIYRWSKSGRMPEPISIGPNKTLWIEEEIINWINDLKNKSRGFGDQVCKVKDEK